MDTHLSSAEPFPDLGYCGFQQLLDLGHVPGRNVSYPGDVRPHIDAVNIRQI